MDKRKRNIIITVCVILGVIGIILIAIYASKSKKGKTYPTQGPSGTPVPTGSTIPTPVPSGSTTPTPVPTGSTTPTPVPSGTTPTPVPTGSTSPPHLPYITTLEQIYNSAIDGKLLNEHMNDYVYNLNSNLATLTKQGKVTTYSITGEVAPNEGGADWIEIKGTEHQAPGIKFFTGDPKDPFRYLVMTSHGVEYQDQDYNIHGLALPYVAPWPNTTLSLTNVNVHDSRTQIRFSKPHSGQTYQMINFVVMVDGWGKPDGYGASTGWSDFQPAALGTADQTGCYPAFITDGGGQLSTRYPSYGCCNSNDAVKSSGEPDKADYTQGTFLWGTLDAWYISDNTGYYIFGSNDPSLNCINPQWQCGPAGQPCPSAVFERDLDKTCPGSCCNYKDCD